MSLECLTHSNLGSAPFGHHSIIYLPICLAAFHLVEGWPRQGITHIHIPTCIPRIFAFRPPDHPFIKREIIMTSSIWQHPGPLAGRCCSPSLCRRQVDNNHTVFGVQRRFARTISCLPIIMDDLSNDSIGDEYMVDMEDSDEYDSMIDDELCCLMLLTTERAPQGNNHSLCSIIRIW